MYAVRGTRQFAQAAFQQEVQQSYLHHVSGGQLQQHKSVISVYTLSVSIP